MRESLTIQTGIMYEQGVPLSGNGGEEATPHMMAPTHIGANEPRSM